MQICFPDGDEEKENSQHIINSIQDKMKEHRNLREFGLIKERVVYDFLEELNSENNE